MSISAAEILRATKNTAAAATVARQLARPTPPRGVVYQTLPTEFVVPIRTINPLNAREHHYTRARRVDRERQATAARLSSKPGLWYRAPLTVCLTRIVGPRGQLLDQGDNLGASLKGVRDEVARWLGVDDTGRNGITWEYGQERGGAWGVRIEIVPGK